VDYRIFSDYKIFEDGTIINRYGKAITKRARAGRYEVRLIVDGKRKNFIVSRLMYWLFVEKFDISNQNLCVAAKDNNYLNVDPSNLYLTERKNLIQGEGHKNRIKLTDEQIIEIKTAYKGNKSGANQYSNNSTSYRDLANKYGVTKGEIAAIIRGETRNPDNYKFK
jgi:hypothetical protein